MKLLSILAVSLIALAANAKNTTVYHDWDGALRGIELNNACITDTEVKTINATKTCTKLVPVERREGDSTFTEWVCKKWEVSQKAYSRSFQREYCAEYGYQDDNQFCKTMGQKDDFLPATIKIAVVTSHGDTDNWPGVTKHFTFPACE